MAEKNLQTRIALKYDSYSEWIKTDVEGKGGNLVLLPGEIGICEIPGTVKSFVENGKTVTVETAPTVLFKVGDANKTAFKDLPWASAKAADVYDWAKASEVKLTVTEVENGTSTKAIEFVGTGKTIPLDYLTKAEVTAITGAIAADVADHETRLQAVETSVGTGSVVEDIATIKERLDTIEGTEGTIAAGDAATLLAANAYADKREEAAKKYTDDELKTFKDETVDPIVTDLSAHVNNKENPHEVTKEQVGLGNVDNKSVATIKSEFTGAVAENNDGFVTGGAAYTAIAAAEARAIADAKGKVDALAETVGTNTTDIAALKTADTNLDARLVKVEAFFGDADDQNKGFEHLDAALDTLVEIKNYIDDGEGQAAKDMLDAIDANAKAIDELEKEFVEGGRVTAAEQTIGEHTTEIASHATDIGALKDIVDGYTAKGSIKTTVDAAAELAQDGVDAAGVAQAAAEAAQAAAEAAQADVDALEKVVLGEDGNGGVKAVADQAAADLAALTGNTGRIKVAEDKIAALEGIIDSGEGKTIRDDVTALKTLTGDSAKGNEALYTEVGRVAGLVEDPNTGLAKTKEIADGAATLAGNNTTRIAAVEADYVKVKNDGIYFGENVIYFDCGSATEVV